MRTAANTQPAPQTMPTGTAPMAPAQLWRLFKEHGDVAARAALIELYLGFSRYVAARCYALRSRDGVAFNEYAQLAAVGLVEAVDSFRLDDGRSSFETYASHRIRGSVLNGLTHLTEVNAQIEARRQVHRRRLASLAPEAISGDLQSRFDQLADVAMGLALSFALDDVRIYRDQGAEGIASDNCYADIEMREMQSLIARLLKELPERERHLIREHYFNDRPFEAIATSFGLTKGRVSQLHKRAISLLHAGFSASRHADWRA